MATGICSLEGCYYILVNVNFHTIITLEEGFLFYVFSSTCFVEFNDIYIIFNMLSSLSTGSIEM